MSKYKCYLLIISFSLIILIQEGTAFKCYKCTSLATQGCKDPFNITQLVFTEDCNYEYQVCLKQEIMSPYHMVEDEIKRGCVHEDYCFAQAIHSSHCSTCRSYLCNSAVSVALAVVPILFLCQCALHLIK